MSRTVYLGTSPFAAAVLRRLAGTDHRPALVISPPDRRQGRGRAKRPPPVALAASELEIDLLQSADTTAPDALERIRAAAPDVGVVCAFGQLIREPLLGELELLNVHPSLLPRWRGAAPIERAIMAGDERTGVCVMRLTAGLDEGPVAACEETAIGRDEDYGSLSERLAALGGDLLISALDTRAAGGLRFEEQTGEATYAEKIERGERLLDPSRPALACERLVRALTPHIGAQLALAGGKALGIRSATASSEGVPSGVLLEEKGALLLGCADRALRIDVVLAPGGKEMASSDYLRGHLVPSMPGG